MDMKTAVTAAVCLVLLTQSSCFTPVLWDATNPRERIAIWYKDISEATLKEKGIRYERYDEGGYFLVEKTSVQKLKDYGVRLLATPVTVALDAATAAVVVGVAVLYMDFNRGVNADPDYGIQLYPGTPRPF